MHTKASCTHDEQQRHWGCTVPLARQAGPSQFTPSQFERPSQKSDGLALAMRVLANKPRGLVPAGCMARMRGCCVQVPGGIGRSGRRGRHPQWQQRLPLPPPAEQGHRRMRGRAAVAVAGGSAWQLWVGGLRRTKGQSGNKPGCFVLPEAAKQALKSPRQDGYLSAGANLPAHPVGPTARAPCPQAAPPPAAGCSPATGAAR